jgi:membrane-bound inhibitor of C-type lysozyme
MEMNVQTAGKWLAGAALTCLLAGFAMAQQEPAQPTQPAKSEQREAPQAPPAGKPHNNVRRAMQWKQADYTCEGGTKLTVYSRDPMVKVRFGEHVYFMKQTESADGNRYSDGKIAWWGKGEDGFLQEDTPGSDGKMIAKGCKLAKTPPPKDHPSGGTGSA